jgi:peptidoglycan/xylan/chitin deacetylase (PgdA/CDA1 family)
VKETLTARSFFILTLVISLIFGGILKANITIGIDALAKKSSKKISDRNTNGENGHTSDSRGKGSSLDSEDDISFKKDTKPTESIVPLPAEIPTNNKVVIINFDDSHQSDYTYAKPILDKYGFKGTFFIVCDWAGAVKSQTPRMTWQNISQLYKEGHDIESHSMTHTNA